MPKQEKGWPVLAFDNPETLKLPPRPGIRRACPKCGIHHTDRAEIMACLSDHSQP